MKNKKWGRRCVQRLYMPTAFHFSFFTYNLFCVSCLEGRSVRSTERSEARKGAAP